MIHSLSSKLTFLRTGKEGVSADANRGRVRINRALPVELDAFFKHQSVSLGPPIKIKFRGRLYGESRAVMGTKKMQGFGCTIGRDR
tara:strand:- start:15 stop:272 length:258 start_codon:yes stop_codon:yes gene_type:complete